MAMGARMAIHTGQMTITTIPMATPINARLALNQWLSPSFPVSSYAYSGGLETAVAEGAVASPDAVEDWARVGLRAGTLRNDAILLSLTLREALPDAELADLAQALAGSAERWRETRDQGVAFADTLVDMGHAVPKVAYPVAFGVAARPLGLPVDEVAQLFLQAQIGAIVSAAIRLVPIGQAAGQGIIARMAPEVAKVATEAAQAGIGALGGAAFGADLAAMRHETDEVRLFRS